MATMVAEARVCHLVVKKIVDRGPRDLRRDDIVVLHEGTDDEVELRVIAAVPLPRLQDPHMEQEFKIYCIASNGKERQLIRRDLCLLRVIPR